MRRGPHEPGRGPRRAGSGGPRGPHRRAAPGRLWRRGAGRGAAEGRAEPPCRAEPCRAAQSQEGRSRDGTRHALLSWAVPAEPPRATPCRAEPCHAEPRHTEPLAQHGPLALAVPPGRPGPGRQLPLQVQPLHRGGRPAQPRPGHGPAGPRHGTERCPGRQPAQVGAVTAGPCREGRQAVGQLPRGAGGSGAQPPPRATASSGCAARAGGPVPGGCGCAGCRGGRWVLGAPPSCWGAAPLPAHPRAPAQAPGGCGRWAHVEPRGPARGRAGGTWGGRSRGRRGAGHWEGLGGAEPSAGETELAGRRGSWGCSRLSIHTPGLGAPLRGQRCRGPGGDAGLDPPCPHPRPHPCRCLCHAGAGARPRGAGVGPAWGSLCLRVGYHGGRRAGLGVTLSPRPHQRRSSVAVQGGAAPARPQPAPAPSLPHCQPHPCPTASPTAARGRAAGPGCRRGAAWEGGTVGQAPPAPQCRGRARAWLSIYLRRWGHSGVSPQVGGHSGPSLCSGGGTGAIPLPFQEGPRPIPFRPIPGTRTSLVLGGGTLGQPGGSQGPVGVGLRGHRGAGKGRGREGGRRGGAVGQRRNSRRPLGRSWNPAGA